MRYLVVRANGGNYLAKVVFFTKNKLKNLPKPPISLVTFFYRKLLKVVAGKR
jgi:hypothetical protein